MKRTMRNHSKLALMVLILCSFILSRAGLTTVGAEGFVTTLIPAGNGALDPARFQYMGAFRLLNDEDGEENSFAYSGEALSFYEMGDGGKGSLYLTGHNWYTYTAEITIPKPSLSRDAEALPQSAILQPFSDIRGNLFSRWDLEIPRVGLEVIDDTLFFCWGAHFEEQTGWGTHGARKLDLSLPPPKSVCRVGDARFLYSTNDYLFKIPSLWADEYLPGYDLASGRFRDGGWSGMGPALFAIRSGDILRAGMDEPVNAVPLIFYDSSYQGDTGAKMTGYSHADSISGGAWVDTPMGGAVIFSGTHGFGKTWYGFANGVEYPLDGNEEQSYPEVPEPPYEQRGWWNSDFRPVMLLYNPVELARAAKKELEANQLQPYALLDLSGFMLREKLDTDMQLLGDMAYDSARSMLYLLELFADGDRPVVHVFYLGE